MYIQASASILLGMHASRAVSLERKRKIFMPRCSSTISIFTHDMVTSEIGLVVEKLRSLQVEIPASPAQREPLRAKKHARLRPLVVRTELTP